jgi:nitroreductase
VTKLDSTGGFGFVETKDGREIYFQQNSVLECSGQARARLVAWSKDRMQDISPEERRLYASVDTGFIGQNVYLFCASEGLGTVFRGSVDYNKLAQAMRLEEAQFVTFAQTVGYPKA